jgi:hypothetical protein
MRNDTTLADLLSKEDYEKVKEVLWKAKGGCCLFHNWKLINQCFASSLLMESGIGCDEPCNGTTDIGRSEEK